MRPVKRIWIGAFLLVLAIAQPVYSLPNSGTGVFTEAPLVFASWIGAGEFGTGYGYEIVAYHLETEGETKTKLIARRQTFAQTTTVEDVELDQSALTLTWDEKSKLWFLWLDADLPSIGVIDLVLVTGRTPFSRHVHCWNFYDFFSTSAGLSFADQNIYGTIAGGEINNWECNVWGWNVSGRYMLPPVGTSPLY